MATPQRTFELRGPYVVVAILALTGIVGALFVYLGPRATAKSPGVVHVGLRYADEGSINFLRYGKKGPPASLRLSDADGVVVLEANELGIGRNLVPIENLSTGNYTAALAAPDYRPVELPVRIEGRMLRAVRDAELPQGSLVDDNMIGVRFAVQE